MYPKKDFTEPSIKTVDGHREVLLDEWQSVVDNEDVTPLQAHKMHMLAMMLDLMYWTWRRSGKLRFEPVTAEVPIKGKRFLS